MPPYQATPLGNNPVQLLTPGIVGYAFGSLQPGPTRLLQVTSVAKASSVATVGVSVREGNTPQVGDVVSIAGTSSNSGAFNVSNKTLTGVSIDPILGTGTVTFAFTAGTITTTPDAGQMSGKVSELTEAAVSGTKSKAFAVSGYGISWAFTFPSAPASASIQLEGAISDNDAEYTIIGSADTTVSGYNTHIATLPENVNFVRLNLTALSGGTNPSIVAKIMNSKAPGQ